EPVAGDETDEGDGDADAQDGGTASAGGYGSVQTAGPGEDDGAGDTTSGPVIALVGGKPVDGPVQVKTKKGDKVRFTVTSDEAGEVHVHGFDIEKDVAPEEDAKFNFEAGFEGIFEIELHGQDGEVEIGSVRVEPR
ncbi:MAG: hypothetical protein ACE5EV_06930, partial [Gaiellales bacterium]